MMIPVPFTLLDNSDCFVSHCKMYFEQVKRKLFSKSMNYGAASQRRYKRQALSKNGDIVIVSASRNHYQALRLEAGQIYNCKYGHFAHDDMIGKQFGSWIISKTMYSRHNRNKNKNKNNENKDNNDSSSNTKNNKHIGKKRGYPIKSRSKSKIEKRGELCLLRPNCELWTLSLSHRTQILYDADKSLITYLLQIKPNDIIFESGTGSGSLSTSFSRIISPFGQLFTFEFNQLRAEYARIDFKNLFIDNLITVIHRNIVQNGFPNKKQLIQIINDIINQYKSYKEKSIENNKDKDETKNRSEYKDSFGGRDKIKECVSFFLKIICLLYN